ncbi:helix-turn-helix domain-containing protein [Cytobacillus gottheilii]|uniref:helix-turn-helix domain-containing protein n=1 Tax=Cytobacillus gottheilii TaxID=859144 RepID=UPI0009B9CFA3|nr:helix-turn-helix transcriptional regulator [Cytobacillus gottheilii]
MLTGKQLKIKRIELDIKAKEIAEFLGICKTYVSKMEREVQGIPIHMYEKWYGYLLSIKNKLI